tara:strand:+ start:62003 stop:62362 length:360 start_codon:yes stop_codon:yes gene_type:complete
MRAFLRGKIHRATVTEADLDYEGSVGIDEKLMQAAGIAEWEKVAIYDVTNGSRIETYAVPLQSESGEICINGAAAHLIHPGDLVIILAYQYLDTNKQVNVSPNIVRVNDNNQIIEILNG